MATIDSFAHISSINKCDKLIGTKSLKIAMCMLFFLLFVFLLLFLLLLHLLLLLLQLLLFVLVAPIFGYDGNLVLFFCFAVMSDF
jgi:hypothetical protein